jgi:GGDEF domain-containing protein
VRLSVPTEAGEAAHQAPHALLCAAPSADRPTPRQQRLAGTLEQVLDHLAAMVSHAPALGGQPSPIQPAAPATVSGGLRAPGGSRGLRGLEDPVTGLLTREVILARLDDEVARAKRYGGGLSALVCDLDESPAGADGADPAARRAILATLGATLRAQLRQIDSAGHYGPHSFLVVLPETGAEESLTAATRLGQVVAEAVAGVGLGLPPVGAGGASDRTIAPARPATGVAGTVLRFGGSTYPAPAQSAADLLAQAEDALAAVRASGGEAWLGHALDRLNEPPAGGYRCVCRRCGKVFQVPDRAQQRARRFCSHECYTLARRAGGQERDDQIRAMRREGCSLREIARRFGLSAERVRQILEAPASAAE